MPCNNKAPRSDQGFKPFFHCSIFRSSERKLGR